MSTVTTADAEHRADMHRRIVRAAEACFADFGPARTTMADVARVAGVSRPTVYRYFRDREALMVEVVVRRVRGALAAAAEVLERRGPFDEALRDTISMLVERGREDPMIRKLFVDQEQESPEIWHVALTLSAEFWEPALSAAEARGDLRSGLVIEESCVWLAEMLLFLVGRSWREGALDTEVVLREFVIPALTGASVAA